MKSGWLVAVGMLCLACAGGKAPAQQFKATPVATGLAYPLNVTSAPGDPSRLFIIEQRGKIRVVDVSPTGAYSLRATPLVDLTSQLSSTYLEYGVLGLAWHPDWVHNGIFYVTYTPGSSATLADWALLRFKTAVGNPSVADMTTQTTILRIPYTITQHRAGWIAFGPDGYLYATTGDGGENDPSNAGADPTVLRGKVLRIDVNGPDGIPGTADDDGFPADPLKNYRVPVDNPFVVNPPVVNAAPEIWAYGLRNPWRASFDRVTGDLWIGDVGQNAWEEVDYGPAGVGGRFYGWRCLEGTHASGLSGCGSPLPPSIPPAFEYPHSGTGVATGSSVTGGYVYRGCAMPSLRGTYFFGDWGGKVWTATPSNGALTNVVNRTAELAAPGTLVSFGEDAYGELYFVNWSTSAGAVYKIEPRALDGPDCNANGKPDLCDIARGVSMDRNGNGIPDECEPPCAADFNHDLTLSSQDIFDFINAWFAGDARTDVDQSGTLNQLDIFAYIGMWFTGC
jgi:glucose/arabinose dehydrogenase